MKSGRFATFRNVGARCFKILFVPHLKHLKNQNKLPLVEVFQIPYCMRVRFSPSPQIDTICATMNTYSLVVQFCYEKSLYYFYIIDFGRSNLLLLAKNI